MSHPILKTALVVGVAAGAFAVGHASTGTVSYVTPASCLAALSAADGLIGTAASMSTAVAAHMQDDQKLFTQLSTDPTASADWYTTADTAFSQKITALDAKVTGSDYADQKAACQGS